jgi:hypothetical protein
MADNSARRVNPLVRVVLWYLALGALIFVADRYFPWVGEVLLGGRDVSPAGVVNLGGQVTQQVPAEEVPAFRLLSIALVAMAMSFFLLMPIVEVFTATRSKRGYRQAMVQTLVILPVVVAGTIILVRNNLALAFALGGVVGAVSFRNRLEDPKDAVYVFLAIAVGLACGVQAYPIAFAMSLFFNLVILMLWYTDFGRMPAELAKSVATRRIEQARGVVGAEGKRSAEFVSVLDQQVLRSMTPDQLSALADRALKHKQRMSRDILEVEDRYDGSLKVIIPESATDTVKAAVEAVLVRDAKDWRFERAASHDGGKAVVEYKVRFRKKVPMPLLLEAVRRAALPHAEQVTFE